MIEISDSEEESKPYGVSVILRDFRYTRDLKMNIEYEIMNTPFCT